MRSLLVKMLILAFLYGSVFSVGVALPPQPTEKPTNITTVSPIPTLVPNTTTVAPDTTTPTPPTPPTTTTTTTTTTAVPPTTTTATTTTTSTTPAPNSTTPATTTTTSTPTPTTPKPTPQPTSKPEPDRKFDGPSFIGGMILTMGLMAIAFVSWKFYKARTERNYHTL